jgi:hypothetical protein
MRNIWFWIGLAGLGLTLESRGANGSTSGISDDAPLDLAPFGYMFRPDAPGGSPPETQWLTNDAPDVLAGVMWEEHRPVRRVEIEFAEEPPEASQLSLEITTSTPTEKQDNRPTWWTRRYELFPGIGTRTERRLLYEASRTEIEERLSKYPEGFRYEADPKGLIFVDKIRLRHTGTGRRPTVVALRAFGVSTVVPLRVEVEWGFQGQRAKGLDGRIEIYRRRG